MRIRYSQLKIRTSLILSVLFFLFAVWELSDYNQGFFVVFFFLIYTILQLGMVIFRTKKPYLEIINDDKIIVNHIFKKEIQISGITEIRKIFGAFELSVADKKTKLYKDVVHKEDLSIFEDYFDKLTKTLTEKK